MHFLRTPSRLIRLEAIEHIEEIPAQPHYAAGASPTRCNIHFRSGFVLTLPYSLEELWTAFPLDCTSSLIHRNIPPNPTQTNQR